MKFYRQATGQDFQKTEILFEAEIPLDVRILFNSGDKRKAIQRWREKTGIGMQTLAKRLDEYEAFRQAFTDFLADKPVYTEY